MYWNNNIYNTSNSNISLSVIGTNWDRIRSCSNQRRVWNIIKNKKKRMKIRIFIYKKNQNQKYRIRL